MQVIIPTVITRKEAKEIGAKRYFTGKECKYGHVADRFCSSGRCSECDSVLQKSTEYRAKRRIYEQTLEIREKRSIYNKTTDRKESLARMQKVSYRKNKPACLMRLLVSRFPKAIRNGLMDMETHQKLGYSLHEFKAHIESKFLSGMSWDNHGKWHIDHIMPVSKFPAEKIHKLNQLSNLQPLWAFDNLSKGDRIEVNAD